MKIEWLIFTICGALTDSNTPLYIVLSLLFAMALEGLQ